MHSNLLLINLININVEEGEDTKDVIMIRKSRTANAMAKSVKIPKGGNHNPQIGGQPMQWPKV